MEELAETTNTEAATVVKKQEWFDDPLDSLLTTVKVEPSFAPEPKQVSRSFANIGSSLTAMRWGSVMVGLIFAAIRASEGELKIVATLAITIFLTSWRTISPINLGARKSDISLFFATADVAILSVAIGIYQGFANPFVGCSFVAIALVAFGWGLRSGVFAALIAVVLTTFVFVISEGNLEVPDLLDVLQICGFLAVVAILPGIAMKRILEMEDQGQRLKNQRDRLVETNDLLEVLNDLARTLPSSLDLTDVVQATKAQLLDTFHARRIVLLAKNDQVWKVLAQDDFSITPEVATEDLPDPLPQVSTSLQPILIHDLSEFTDRFGSGLYARLITNNVDTGLLAMEHPDIGYFSETDKELFAGMTDVLALTLANARSFNRLRSLAANEERSRIARDLHDRLGQYLTYISLELERIKSGSESENEDLGRLHGDVQEAIKEFRDTLLELRTTVTAERPLAAILEEVVERFRKRSRLEVDLKVVTNDQQLPLLVENELLRIAQEALTNIDKHAQASKVYVRWTIADGKGVLLINDNGRGFEPAKGIRGNAYGLVGMSERAAAIGAQLEVSSAPGHGTNIIVQSTITVD